MVETLCMQCMTVLLMTLSVRGTRCRLWSGATPYLGAASSGSMKGAWVLTEGPVLRRALPTLHPRPAEGRGARHPRASAAGDGALEGLVLTGPPLERVV